MIAGVYSCSKAVIVGVISPPDKRTKSGCGVHMYTARKICVRNNNLIDPTFRTINKYPTSSKRV